MKSILIIEDERGIVSIYLDLIEMHREKTSEEFDVKVVESIDELEQTLVSGKCFNFIFWDANINGGNVIETGCMKRGIKLWPESVHAAMSNADSELQMEIGRPVGILNMRKPFDNQRFLKILSSKN